MAMTAMMITKRRGVGKWDKKEMAANGSASRAIQTATQINRARVMSVQTPPRV